MRGLRKIVFIQVFIVFLLLIVNGFVFAQRPLEVNYPTIEGVRPQDTSFSLPEYVKYIFNFSLGLAGLIAFIVLFYAGFIYMTSAGSLTKQKDAKARVRAAFLGLLVLAGSYMILTTINPQLVFLSIPGRVVFNQEYINTVEPREKGTLYYTEIPIGGLIEEVFTKTRTDSMLRVSQGAKTVSELMADKAEAINSLTSQCACSVSSPECGGKCSGGFCVGDPCPAKGTINQKRAELTDIISDTGSSTTIPYWQNKLEVVINGSSEEKIIGFKQVYDDLIRAEDLIKTCSLSASPRGSTQSLMDYNDFWQYRQKLEEDQSIKKSEPTYPFDYISSDNTYLLATFYCVEQFYSIVPEPIDTEVISQAGKEAGAVLGSGGETCSAEIPSGQAVDNAEELAGKILAELENIKNNISREITATQNLIASSDPEGCVASNCFTECNWIEQQCWVPTPCPPPPPPPECTEPPCEPPPPPPESGSPAGGFSFVAPWWNWLFLKPNYSFAEDCGGVFVDCSYCEIPACSGSSCLDTKPEIGAQAAEVTGSSSQITSSYGLIKDFIGEKGIPDSLKISNILTSLGVAKNELSICYNSKEAQRKAEAGAKTVWKNLYPCSDLKEAIQGGNLFYDESGQEITDCYGTASETPDRMDNFLCCQSEIF